VAEMSKKSGDGLATRAKRFYYSPTAQDAKNSTLPDSQASRRSLIGNLIQDLILPTPKASDPDRGICPSELSRNTPSLAATVHEDGYRLNPAFVCQMMGFPARWTDFSVDDPGLLNTEWEYPTEPPVIPIKPLPKNYQAQLKAMGNAIVPTVAYQIFLAIEEVEKQLDTNVNDGSFFHLL